MINKSFNKAFIFHLDNKFLINLSGITSNIITSHLIVKIRISLVSSYVDIVGQQHFTGVILLIKPFCRAKQMTGFYMKRKWVKQYWAIKTYLNDQIICLTSIE